MRFWLSSSALLISATTFGADVPISGLPAASSVSGSDVVPIVQSATTKKASFTVQKSLWDTFYQPLDGDLTALAALSGTHTIYYRSAANTWSAVTIGANLDFTGATLSATGVAASDAHFLTNQAEAGLANEINLGALSTGLIKGTVAAGVSTISSITDNSTNWDTAFTDRLKWDGGATGLTASTGRASLGANTVGSSFFTLTNPSAVTFPRINADNTVDALDATSFRAAIGAGTGGGDVSSNTSTSVDSEIALFDGTSGKSIKRATTTGILKGTSGVISAATGGTDYTNMSFSTIVVNGGAQSDLAADSASDTLAITEGTGITLTTNAGTDTLTITAVGGSPYKGADATNNSVDVANTAYQTIVSKSVTGLVANDTLIVDVYGTLLNNSGAGRTYSYQLNVGAVAVMDFADASGVGASANPRPLHFTFAVSISATNVWRVLADVAQGAAAVLANTSTTYAGTNTGMAWNSGTSDLTGTNTVTFKIKSNNGTATQTFTIHSYTIQRVPQT